MRQILLLMMVGLVFGLPVFAADPPQVTEIRIHRIQGLGVGVADLLTLRADGTAEYVGTARAERLGRYRGNVSRSEFDKLVKALREYRFYELEDTYRGRVPGTNRPVTDAPGILLTVSFDGKKKLVSDYGYGGPDNLRQLQRVILDSTKTISWRKDDQALQ